MFKNSSWSCHDILDMFTFKPYTSVEPSWHSAMRLTPIRSQSKRSTSRPLGDQSVEFVHLAKLVSAITEEELGERICFCMRLQRVA